MLDKQLTPMYPTFSYEIEKDQVQVQLDFIQGQLPKRSIKIWGKVRNEWGQPMPYVLLYLYRYWPYDATYEPVGGTFTDEDGMYCFEVKDYVPPVGYTLFPCTQEGNTWSQMDEASGEKDSNDKGEEEVNRSSGLYIAQNKPFYETEERD